MSWLKLFSPVLAWNCFANSFLFSLYELQYNLLRTFLFISALLLTMNNYLSDSLILAGGAVRGFEPYFQLVRLF